MTIRGNNLWFARIGKYINSLNQIVDSIVVFGFPCLKLSRVIVNSFNQYNILKKYQENTQMAGLLIKF